MNKVIRYNLKFKGSGWEFFFMSLILGFLTVITFGILAPAWLFYTVRFFIEGTNIIEEKTDA